MNVGLLLLPLVIHPELLIEVREIEVELLETNTVTNRSDDGIRFIQVVAWDKGLDENNRPCAIDRGYKVVKNGYPAVHICGEWFRVVWWSGPYKVYILKAKEHLVTETPYDREMEFRNHGGWFKPCW